MEKERKRKIPFLDLRVTNNEERKELLNVIDTVFKHGRIVLGPEVQALEKQVANFCSRKYAVGVNSGTDSLFLGLKSLDIGVGDEVITTSLSWIATANAIALTGAVPVFADICEDLNIDPKSIKRLITPHTKAILPVHYTGKICQMAEITKIGEEHNIPIVEDAAQSFGAIYRGRKAGSFGKIGCFSMNPMKIFAACGEAGMIVTDDKKIYNRLISLRYNGTINKEKCIEPSLNGRIDTIQAAILLKRFKKINQIIQKRRKIASFYNKQLKGLVKIPEEEKGARNVYYTYTIRASKRDELKKFLESKGIETKIQHPYLMSQQSIYNKNPRDKLKNANKIVKEILCIPASEKLEIEDLNYITDCIKEFYNG